MWEIFQFFRTWLSKQHGGPWFEERNEETLLKEAEDELRKIIREEIAADRRDRKE